VDAVAGVKVAGVDDLLASFGSTEKRSPREVAVELKKMVGLEPTPPPPDVATTGRSSVVKAADEGLAGEAAPTLGDSEFRTPRAPRAARAISVTLLVLLLGALVALYLFYPQLFTGR